MKAKFGAALAASAVVIWSVVQRGGSAASHREAGARSESWRSIEQGGRVLASGAQGVLERASHEGTLAARGLGRHVADKASGLPELANMLASGQAGQTISAAQIASYEKQLCDLANRERAQRGLPILKISPVLAQVARGHSREMASKNYFAHESPTPGRKSPMDRYKLIAKETPRLIAENIYKVEGSALYRLKPADFRGAHTGWMKSPGHRANILRSQPAGGPTQIGVGIVVRGSSFWATQNFARP